MKMKQRFAFASNYVYVMKFFNSLANTSNSVNSGHFD